MIIRTVLFVSALALASQVMAEDAAKQEAPKAKEMKLTYCEQLGNTAGFQDGDLQAFILECEERKAAESQEKPE